MFLKLFKMQDELNRKLIGEEWIERFQYDNVIHFPIIEEFGELIQSTNYAWWKNEKPDILRNIKDLSSNYYMELVDLLHFLMTSDLRNLYLITGAKDNELYELISFYLLKDNNSSTFYRNIGRIVDLHFKFISDVLNRTIDYVPLLVNLFYNFVNTLALKIDKEPVELLTHIYNLYIGKHTLNKFRYDNGYKTGKYNKIWAGREDNKYLIEYVLQNSNRVLDEDEIYEYLAEQYKKYGLQ